MTNPNTTKAAIAAANLARQRQVVKELQERIDCLQRLHAEALYAFVAEGGGKEAHERIANAAKASREAREELAVEVALLGPLGEEANRAGVLATHDELREQLARVQQALERRRELASAADEAAERLVEVMHELIAASALLREDAVQLVNRAHRLPGGAAMSLESITSTAQWAYPGGDFYTACTSLLFKLFGPLERPDAVFLPPSGYVQPNLGWGDRSGSRLRFEAAAADSRDRLSHELRRIVDRACGPAPVPAETD